MISLTKNIFLTDLIVPCLQLWCCSSNSWLILIWKAYLMDTFPLISQKSELKMGTVTAIYSYIFGQSISLLLQFICAAVRCFWCELVARSFVHWEYDWNYICSEFCLIQKSRYWRCYLAREDAARPRISDSSDSAAHRNWPDYFSYARFGPLFLFKLGVLRFNHKNGACLFLSVSLCVTKSSPGP